jgi:hypothetical protein
MGVLVDSCDMVALPDSLSMVGLLITHQKLVDQMS